MENNSAFKIIQPAELERNAIRLIGEEWMLITAGSVDKYNTMTASWGGLGMLWNKPVVFIFIRPQRFTYHFIQDNNLFTCSFFEPVFRPALQFCGAHSGRDVDKASVTGLTPCLTPSGSVTFRQASIYLECRKLYYDDLRPENFLDNFIGRNYPDRDYHRMFIGEIINCGIK